MKKKKRKKEKKKEMIHETALCVYFNMFFFLCNHANILAEK